jgi:hypothetical protein
MASLYETDFHEWTVRTAEQIRSGRIPPEELEHIAEEVEALGSRDRRELRNRLKILLQHLIKCALREGRPTASWENTITDQRDAIAALLEQSPSLRPTVEDASRAAYPTARRLAATEMKIARAALPEELPFPVEKILDPEFYPGSL